MTLTRWTHSCVSITEGTGVLVVDPGIWSEPQALLAADAVLLTHEHSDHADLLRLAGAGLPVLAPVGADLRGLPFTPVSAGDQVTAAGLTVRAVGGQHAAVMPGQRACVNLGYVVETSTGAIYHPGDALHVPDEPVETLLVPMQASWLKTVEAVEFVQDVAPTRAIGIHDGQVNDRARSSINHWIAEHGGAPYTWLAPGTDS